MQGEFRPMWGNCPRGHMFAHPGVNSQWILANRVHRIHGGHVVDVISSTGAARAKGWFVGWNGKVPQGGRNSQDEKDLHPTESQLRLSLANRVHRIHREHVVDVIFSTGVAGCKEWSVGC